MGAGLLSFMQGNFPKAANSRTGSRVTRVGYQLRGAEYIYLKYFLYYKIYY
jgi:hypothetical protein